MIPTTDPESAVFHKSEHKTVVADSVYKTPWICKRIFESERVLSTCYTGPKTKENGPAGRLMYMTNTLIM